MDILYISHLSDKISAGPNWSVPASIRAQSNLDNVLWINITSARMKHWLDVKCFYDIGEYRRLEIEKFTCTFFLSRLGGV